MGIFLFGDRIASIRKERRLKQTELAELLGVSVDSVRRWEQGKQEPRVGDLEKIASLLDTSTTYLLGGNTKAYLDDDGPNKHSDTSGVELNNKEMTYEYTRRDEKIKLTFPESTTDEVMERRIGLAVRATFQAEPSKTSSEDAQEHAVGGDTVGFYREPE